MNREKFIEYCERNDFLWDIKDDYLHVRISGDMYEMELCGDTVPNKTIFELSTYFILLGVEDLFGDIQFKNMSKVDRVFVSIEQLSKVSSEDIFFDIEHLYFDNLKRIPLNIKYGPKLRGIHINREEIVYSRHEFEMELNRKEMLEEL